MFDFFKETYLELNGVDLSNKNKIKNNELISKGNKIFIRLIAVLYFIYFAVRIYIVFKFKSFNLFLISKDILLLVLSLTYFIFTFLNKNKYVVYIIFAIFVTLNFILF